MIKKKSDEIFQSFLEHELLESKYDLKKNDLKLTVREGLNSDIPIIKSIAIIVDGLERRGITDTTLKSQVIQYLNENTSKIQLKIFE